MLDGKSLELKELKFDRKTYWTGFFDNDTTKSSSHKN